MMVSRLVVIALVSAASAQHIPLNDAHKEVAAMAMLQSKVIVDDAAIAAAWEEEKAAMKTDLALQQADIKNLQEEKAAMKTELALQQAAQQSMQVQLQELLEQQRDTQEAVAKGPQAAMDAIAAAMAEHEREKAELERFAVEATSTTTTLDRWTIRRRRFAQTTTTDEPMGRRRLDANSKYATQEDLTGHRRRGGPVPRDCKGGDAGDFLVTSTGDFCLFKAENDGWNRKSASGEKWVAPKGWAGPK